MTKFPHSENSVRRNLFTAKFLYGEISVRQNFQQRDFLTEKFPYGQISHGETSYVDISYIQRKTFLRMELFPSVEYSEVSFLSQILTIVGLGLFGHVFTGSKRSLQLNTGTFQSGVMPQRLQVSHNDESKCFHQFNTEIFCSSLECFACINTNSR